MPGSRKYCQAKRNFSLPENRNIGAGFTTNLVILRIGAYSGSYCVLRFLLRTQVSTAPLRSWIYTILSPSYFPRHLTNDFRKCGRVCRPQQSTAWSCLSMAQHDTGSLHRRRSAEVPENFEEKRTDSFTKDVEESSTEDDKSGQVINNARDLVTHVISVADDPTLSPWTFRTAIIGLGLSVFGGVLGRDLLLQAANGWCIDYVPCGYFVRRGIGYGNIHSRRGIFRYLNPFPFNKKEKRYDRHNGKCGSKFRHWYRSPCRSERLFYNITPNPAASIFLLFSSQLIGYGIAGLMRCTFGWRFVNFYLLICFMQPFFCTRRRCYTPAFFLLSPCSTLFFKRDRPRRRNCAIFLHCILCHLRLGNIPRVVVPAAHRIFRVLSRQSEQRQFHSHIRWFEWE